MAAEIQERFHSAANGGEGRSLSLVLPGLEGGFSPSRIVSLYDLMKSFDASFWMEVVQSTPPQGAMVISNTVREDYLRAFTSFKDTVAEIGLPCSGTTVDKLLSVIAKEPCTHDEVNEIISELKSRVTDEMKGREFFALTAQESGYYHKPREKWEAIIERFPNAGNDVEESWKCLACSRYTAAVFHSLQVVETGLIELGKFIGVTDPLSGWTSVAQRLKKILDTKYDQLSQFEKDNRVFLEQAQGTVESLKNAWRNKISHAHGKLFVMTGEEFHPDVAEEILLATRAFMRRLAEGLPKTPLI